ncbi:MAG: UDP-N-acetylmuramoyl-L-alanine--D-glutamate ligase [Actinomycetota bacterium]|nr:UDP-N-acetylmuramoyl-L-alanine--D-glutamate ligase [Actinomycetota bacterium]
MKELEGIQSVLVVGLGLSGKAAASKLLDIGLRVTANDISTSPELIRSTRELAERGARVELGHHDLDLLSGGDLIVVSPGVPARLPLLRRAVERGIPVWGEIEMASRFVRGPLIAVTGTNGKTTTVSMIERILRQAGKGIHVAGNIGYPLIEAVDEMDEGDTVVVEVSSFQLVHTVEFHPEVAVLLNIAEDHFDWHMHLEEYVEAKRRIWMNQNHGDLVVCNLDDPLCVEAVRDSPSTVLYFSKLPDPPATTFLRRGRIVSLSRRGGVGESRPIEVMRADSLPLPGEHNVENAMAAVSVGLACGVEPGVVAEALESFEGLHHRLEYVAEVEGVRFFDDSKATNPHAASRALSAFHEPLVIILGGKNKGLDFQDLAMAVAERYRGGGVRAVYTIGDAAPEIEDALVRVEPGLDTGRLPGLEEVFEHLPRVAKPGDVVLFSPACASFDRYDDYRHRGDHFREMVESLRGGLLER